MTIVARRAIEIAAITRTSVLALKSWMPEFAGGGKSVALAGEPLPSQVGQARMLSFRALCVAPGEWLIVSTTDAVSALRLAIEADLMRQGLVLVEQSQGVALLEARGDAVRDLLGKLCCLDLHPRRFQAGQCARTRLAQIPVIVSCLAEPERFELILSRSYSHYLQSWLADASQELASDGS